MNLINWGRTVTLQLRDISNWLIRPCLVLHFVAGVTALKPKRARSVLWSEKAPHFDVNSRRKIGSGEYRASALFLITIQEEVILGLKWTVADLQASRCLFICKWERHWLFPHIWIRGVCPGGTGDLVRLMQQPKNLLFISLVLFMGLISFNLWRKLMNRHYNFKINICISIYSSSVTILLWSGSWWNWSISQKL